MTEKHILIAGDSTVANYRPIDYPMMGWGQALTYFVADHVTFMNFAQGGRSTKSFRDEGHWAKLIAAVKQDDLVFIQFGHNDQKQDNPSIYASIKNYYINLTTMVNEVRDAGGKPVLLTSFPRCIFDSTGKLTNTHGEYPQTLRKVAADVKCPLIDANTIFQSKYTEQDELYRLFTYPSPGGHGFAAGTRDTSHFNIYGAHEMAKMIVENFIEQGLNQDGFFSR